MSNPVVQVQARLGSTRLPGKVLLHLGERRILEWVVTRCGRAKLPGSIVVAIGDQPENEAIEEWCRRHGVCASTGPEDDLLERHRKTAREFDSDPVVRVTGDCPFLPSGEIDRLVREHLESDVEYTTNVVSTMPIGTGVDVIDPEVLDELAARGESHPVRAMRDSPGSWAVSFSPSNPWQSFGRVHLAIDTPADYWTLIDAIEAVGPDPESVVRWIDEQVDVSP